MQKWHNAQEFWKILQAVSAAREKRPMFKDDIKM
jgi:hypothetical protein